MRNKAVSASRWRHYGTVVVCLIFAQTAAAQVESNTAPFKAPAPPNIWKQDSIDAARTQWLAQVDTAGTPSVAATEAVSILRIVGADAVPFTQTKQKIAGLAFDDVMPPGGIVEFITFQEGAPEFDNPDQVSFGEPYVDIAAILWQIPQKVVPGKPVPWGTQSQAVLLWGEALQQRGLNVTVKVLSLNVAQTTLSRQIQLFPLEVVQTLVELDLEYSNTSNDKLMTAAEINATTRTTSGLTPNQTWAVTDGAEKYLNGFATSNIEVSQANQVVLTTKYPEVAANLQPGKALLELQISVYACQEDDSTGLLEAKQPPENCELDVAKRTLDAFFRDPKTLASFSQVGLGWDNTIIAAQYRHIPLAALNPAGTANSGVVSSSEQWLPWHLDILDQRSLPLDGKFTSTADGTGVNIYVISSGMQADHQEFAQKNSDGTFNTDISRVNGLWGVDGIDPKTDCPDGSLWYYFGTWAASIIAGSTVGVAKNATLHSVRMRETCLLDNRNIWSPGALPSALDAVLSTFKKPGIVAIDTWWSPSRLADDDDAFIETEIGWRLQKAAELDIPIFTTAGVGVTSSTPCDNIFSQGKSVIRVSGIDSSLGASITGSTNSNCIDIWAPGGGLTAAITGASANNKDEYTSVVPRGFGGAWLVAGMAAQYLQLHPNATFSELKKALLDASTLDVVQKAGPESNNALAFTNLMSPPNGESVNSESNGGAVNAAGDNESNDGNISTGAIVGIAIAALVASIVAIALFMTSSRKKKMHILDGDMSGSVGKLGAFLHQGNSGSSGTSSIGKYNKNSGSHGGENGATAATATATPTPLNAPAKIKKHDWEIKEDQIEYVPGPDGSSEYWVLGRGRYGEVRRALKDGIQEVAVKTLRRDIDALGELPHDAFAREIAVMQWLSRDANVVQFFGACVRPGSMLLVTELMEGGDLRARLRPHASSLKNRQGSDQGNNNAGFIDSSDFKSWGWYGRGKGVALDVAKGLHFLHSHGVVHRDIKSKNILLGRDGRAKLGDVGLAYISFSETPENSEKKKKRRNGISSSQGSNEDDGFVGTFAFSAPELILCGACTPKADVYSFGVVLWEILTGEVAQRGHLRPPIVPEECPEGVVDVLNACLSADPDERPSAREAYEFLLACPPFESSTGYEYQQHLHQQQLQGQGVYSTRLSNGSTTRGDILGGPGGFLTSPPLPSPLVSALPPAQPGTTAGAAGGAAGALPQKQQWGGGDSLSLPSLHSDSLPSISTDSHGGVIRNFTNAPFETKTGGATYNENETSKSGGTTSRGGGGGSVEDSQASSSSIMRSLGTLTPGLRSVVHQIRKRFSGDAAENQEIYRNSETINNNDKINTLATEV
ncbi:hypothetical protein Ndes2526A_g01353 [Nannochloris sp. 'desiccata']